MIFKHPNHNNYINTEGGYWVRDFTKVAPQIDINKITSPKDYIMLSNNTTINESKGYTNIDSESHFCLDVVIVSDGYGFKENLHLLKELPQKVKVIGVNKSLARWDLKVRRMDYYVVNNPYDTCLSYLPTVHNYYPPCISSTRTYPLFLESYRGFKYIYRAVSEQKFCPEINKGIWQIDDYRNPICAALGLCYRFNAVNILLFCCDELLKEERPGADKIGELWQYPQHKIPHALIDGNMYWLKNIKTKKIKIANFSLGNAYINASTVDAKGVLDFFNHESIF